MVDWSPEQVSTGQHRPPGCRFAHEDQYARIWPLDVDSLYPGDFVYPNGAVDDIYRPISRKPIIWLAWRTMDNITTYLIPPDDHRTSFSLELIRVEDKSWRQDIMLPTSQEPFQVGMFGGGDGTHNLRKLDVPVDSGCHSTELAWYVFNWRIPRGIIHEYTYRFRLRVQGGTDSISESTEVFLNATQREKIIGGRLDFAQYADMAKQVQRAVPVHQRMSIAAAEATNTDNLLCLVMTVMVLLFIASFVKRTGGKKKDLEALHRHAP